MPSFILATGTTLHLVGLCANRTGVIGSIGGDSAVNRDQLKQDVVNTLRSIGIDESSIGRVKDVDRGRTIWEYAGAVVYHVQYCVLNPTQSQQWQAEVVKIGQPPKPDELMRLLDQFGVHDDFTDKVLDEYRNFLNSGQHRDIQFWHDRDHWPINPIPSNGDKSVCRLPLP